MEHIDCVKKWPAVYSLMAVIMDDVAVSEEKAVQKWGALAVTIATQRHNSAIKEVDVATMFSSIVHNLNFGHKLVEVNAKEAPPPAAAQQATNPGGVVSRGAALSQPSRIRKSTRFQAEVLKTYTVEKDAKYGGGQRHMMSLRLGGDVKPIAGSIPKDFIGKVVPGHVISLEAQVWSFEDRDGWFKYPKNLSILSQAAPTRGN